MSDIWTTRIEAARDALSRTRYAFVVATIVSVAISVAEFNSTFSWYEQFTQPRVATPTCQTATSSQAQSATAAAKDRSSKQVALEAVIQEWVKSNRMAVSLLGVNFGMSDAPILGSLSLAIISLWFYFCIRRENHLIAGILRDARKADGAVQQRTFYGITGYLVFTTLTNGDEPIFLLDQPISHKPFFLRPYIRVILYLPALTIAFIVLSDVFSLCLPPAIRETCDPAEPLIVTIYHDPSRTRWFFQLVFMELFALLIFGLTFRICMYISRFERATNHLLKRFHASQQGTWRTNNSAKLSAEEKRRTKMVPLYR